MFSSNNHKVFLYIFSMSFHLIHKKEKRIKKKLKNLDEDQCFQCDVNPYKKNSKSNFHFFVLNLLTMNLLLSLYYLEDRLQIICNFNQFWYIFETFCVVFAKSLRNAECIIFPMFWVFEKLAKFIKMSLET